MIAGRSTAFNRFSSALSISAPRAVIGIAVIGPKPPSGGTGDFSRKNKAPALPGPTAEHFTGARPRWQAQAPAVDHARPIGSPTGFRGAAIAGRTPRAPPRDRKSVV